jgi:hypothetical protein
MKSLKSYICRESEKGLSLLEALVSTAIVGIGFVAVFQLVNFSVGSINVSGERTKINYISGMIAEDIIGSRDSLFGIDPTTSSYAIDNYGKPVLGDGSRAPSSVLKFSEHLEINEWKIDACSANKGVFLSKEDVKDAYVNSNKADAPNNKMERWNSIVAEDRYLRCKNEKDIKSVRVFKICPTSIDANCLAPDANFNLNDILYMGRIQINTNGGNKRKFLYFQADYIFME